MNAQSEIVEAVVVEQETHLPVVQPSRAVSIFDMPVAEFRGSLERRGDNRKALMGWVREAMVDGVDFGRIHVVKKDKCRLGKFCKDQNHFSKPVLFKPGSEKICGMLGVTPTFPTLPDYERLALEGKPIEKVILRCHILSASKEVIADGIGARSVSNDSGDINKALKMACKSAQIDATLRMAGLSEIFTQDLEDMQQRDKIIDDDGDEPERKSDFLDPRGDSADRQDFDPKERNKYVSRFADALNADVEEEERARLVFAIDKELAGKQELYQGIFDVLTPSFRNAIRKYIDMHKKTLK